MQAEVLCELRTSSFSCALPERRHASPVVCRAATEAVELEEDEVRARDEFLPQGVKRLHVTVPADKVAKAWQKAVKLEGRSHDFPGFRQGKKASLSTPTFNPLWCSSHPA